ncbi:MAG: hypothetical protein ACTSUE_03815 [Promethearchaeota archaeon]
MEYLKNLFRIIAGDSELKNTWHCHINGRLRAGSKWVQRERRGARGWIGVM